MKRIISLSLALSVLFLPAGVTAQTVPEREAAFCGSHRERQQAVAGTFSKKIELHQAALQNQADRQASRRLQLDEQLTSARARADIERSESYLLLRNKQKAVEGQSLADAYAGEVDVAVAARRAEYDTARRIFHETVDNLLSERSTAMQRAAQDFQGDATAAVQQAGVDCKSSRADKAAIRRSLVDAMRSSRLNYAEQLRQRQDFKGEVQKAIQDRDEAYKTATVRFQQSMQSIREKYINLED